MPPSQPLFDPTNPRHKDVAEWRQTGPTTAWSINCFCAALIAPDGEARCLLLNGLVARFFQDSNGLIDLEILGSEEVAP